MCPIPSSPSIPTVAKRPLFTHTQNQNWLSDSCARGFIYSFVSLPHITCYQAINLVCLPLSLVSSIHLPGTMKKKMAMHREQNWEDLLPEIKHIPPTTVPSVGMFKFPRPNRKNHKKKQTLDSLSTLCSVRALGSGCLDQGAHSLVLTHSPTKLIAVCSCAHGPLPLSFP